MNGVARSLRLASVFAVLAALTVGIAQGATIEIGPLIMHADGKVSPLALPARKFAPATLHAHAEFERKDGGLPPALEGVVLDLDRDVRLSVGGLAECPVESVAEASPEQARERCRNAIVGEGDVSGLAATAGGLVPFSSPLTILNGPRSQTGPSAIVHLQFASPTLKTFALVAPIEKRQGRYGYRATVDLSPIVEVGSITHFNLRIGRRYVSSGVRRSYAGAHCPDGVLEMRGVFSFADGSTLGGGVSNFCRVR